MALIKCSNCNRDISDKAEKCIHCGTPIHKEKPVKEEIVYNPKTVVETKTTVSPSEEKEYKLKPAVRIVINILANIGLFIMIFIAGTVITEYSGNYSITKIIDYVLKSKVDLCVFIKVFIIIHILVCTVLCTLRSRLANIISLIGYFFFLINESLFCIYIAQNHRWDVNGLYYILLLYTAVWIVYILWSIPKKKKRVVVEEEPVIKEQPDMYKELVKLKELLDMKAITEEEFNDMKKNLLEKQKEHWN